MRDAGATLFCIPPIDREPIKFSFCSFSHTRDRLKFVCGKKKHKRSICHEVTAARAKYGTLQYQTRALLRVIYTTGPTHHALQIPHL
jgi:hypothetical protein